MNSTRVPGAIVSSDGVRTPVAEMVIWCGLSAGDGPAPELEPPQLPAATAMPAITSARSRTTLEPDPDRRRNGAVLRHDPVAGVLVDILQSVRIPAVEHERAVLEASADRHSEVQPLDLIADVDFLG